MSNLLFQSLKPHANLPGTPGSDQAMMCSDSKPLFSLARLSKSLSFAVLLSSDGSSQQMTNFDLKSLWNKAPIDNEKFCPKRQSQAGTAAITSCSGNTLGRESSDTSSHRGLLVKNFPIVSGAEGSPVCVSH